MSRLLCCLCVRRLDMGAALSHPQEGDACEGAPAAPPTMADVIRERKKKAGGAGLGTLRRRLAAAARRPRAGDSRADRGCEHARFIRSVVGSWRLAEVFLLGEELEAGAALRDLATQAELAREPAAALHADLQRAYTDRWWCDVELVGGGGAWAVRAHRAVLAARCTYFRDLLQRYPSGVCRVPLEGPGAALSREEAEACVLALYAGPSALAPPAAPAGAQPAHAPHAARRAALCDLCASATDKWERGAGAEGAELDIINVDGSSGCRGGGGGGCGGGGGRALGRVESAAVRRLGALLGFSVDALHRDMRYLLDSGEYADSRLVFRLEGGCGAQYGFRSALELPCHRVLLAARSRFFRSVMSRRTSGAGVAGGAGGAGGANSGAVCVDEKVLPRRFARALLHAAYTDQVDLSLIGRGSSSPSSTTSTNTGWSGVARGGGGGGGGSPRAAPASALDDAFQLYEIARFVEMPIVVQGCEDCIVEALSAETLPLVLRWAAAPHASPWVHRQAMRYLRDEFPAIMSHAASARLPRAALHAALGSPFLQASEAQALRALLRWAERGAAATRQAAEHREPNVVWHTAHSVSRRAGGGGRRRGEAGDAALREALAPLVALVRTEHLPPDNELLQQLVRRGVVPAAAAGDDGDGEGGGRAADAWLGRGSYRAPRCFLPYLDEIKALLEEQAVPEAEVSRARRARFLHRIPDTLYMVSAARSASRAESVASSSTESACVSPRVLAGLRARVRELRAAPPAARALALHASDTATVYRQMCLRAVRERSLPDACADLLLAEPTYYSDDSVHESGEWEESPRAERRRSEQWGAGAGADLTADCCRAAGAGVGAGARCGSAGSLRAHAHAPLHIPLEGPRSATARRELPARPPDAHAHAHRLVWDEFCSPGRARACAAAGAGGAGGAAGALSLSAAVPDVAMAPNANTHLLTARDYFRPAAPPAAAPAAPPPAAAAAPAQPPPPALMLPHTEFVVAGGGGGGLQLDLGDGATHTPRPGSRAARSAERARHYRDHAQALSCVRTRLHEAELRAAIDLSVVRAYSVYSGGGGGAEARCRPAHAGTLPPCYRAHAGPAPPLLPAAGASPVSAAAAAARARSTPSPGPAGGGGGGGGSLRVSLEPSVLAARPSLALHTPVMRVGSAGGARSRSPSPAGGGSPRPAGGGSPRRARGPRERDLSLYRHHHHDYRVERVEAASYGSSTSGSRGPSPSNYA